LDGTGAALPSGVAKPGQNSAGSGRKSVAKKTSCNQKFQPSSLGNSATDKIHHFEGNFCQMFDQTFWAAWVFCTANPCIFATKNVLDVNAAMYTGPRNSSNFQ
jgi:hypothetical protein